jgi:ribonuclease HII
MALIYAGIDEAGYGPLLGPLCVGLAAVRVRSWAPSAAGAPDLWDMLSGAVCRQGGDKRRRIAVDDSKALKLANTSVRRHALTHLERGVLAFTLCRRSDESCAELSECPCDDAGVLGLLGADVPALGWYAGDPLPAPVAHSAAQIGIARSVLATELDRAGVDVLETACRVIDEAEFNAIVEASGTKAAATEAGIGEHLRTVWERWGGGGGAGDADAVRVVCDRQSGRADYADMLARCLPGATVVQTHRSGEASRYELSGTGADGHPRLMHVLFLTQSERQHLPVALASMIAKLCRETLMARLNRHFAARVPELKPTAGYRQDGWRFVQELGPSLTEPERRVLLRRA